jgi:hypothetical protein
MTLKDIPAEMMLKIVERAVMAGAERLFFFEGPSEVTADGPVENVGVSNHINGCGEFEPFAIIKVADYLDKGKQG